MFQDNFLWGASTSAFQVEGGFGLGGKGKATTDVRPKKVGIADTKVASDHYHHWKEDVHYMAQLGLSVYRFSFNWSRILPDGKNINYEGLQFYHQLIDECLKYGIKPFPTLYHFEMPQALVDNYGGWKSRQCIEDFAYYAQICFKEFGKKVDLWGTVNEMMVVTAAKELTGNVDSDGDEARKEMYLMSYHMSLAEKRAIRIFRELVPSGKIGHVCAMQTIYPASSRPEDNEASISAKDFLQNCFLDMSVFGRYPQYYQYYLQQKGWLPEQNEADKELLQSEAPDFIGANYYSSSCIRALLPDDDLSKLPPFYQNETFTIANNPYLSTQNEWMASGIDAQGLYLGIRDLYERYHLPIIITENGFAYSDEVVDGQINDNYRIEYLDAHIKQCERLIKEEYPLFGYCTWSLLDLVSSHQGFKKRYGLIYVDRTDEEVKDCQRILKKSFYWYQKRIKEGMHQE